MQIKNKFFKSELTKKSRIGNSSPLSSTKVNNQTAIHEQKHLWESSGVHLRNLRLINVQERRASFYLQRSIPQPSFAPSKVETPSQEVYGNSRKDQGSGIREWMNWWSIEEFRAVKLSCMIP